MHAHIRKGHKRVWNTFLDGVVLSLDGAWVRYCCCQEYKMNMSCGVADWVVFSAGVAWW